VSKGKIKYIQEESIASEIGLEKGDVVKRVNNSPLGDIIDYIIATSDDYVEIEIEQMNGDIVIFEIEKEFNEDLGIVFDPPTIEPIKRCQNNCTFCFINQMPPQMRDTLYIKDDDYRLSFLSGSYITGTNITDEDIQRIIDYNLSPLYISVHQTGRERDKLLGRNKSFSIMNFLKKLKAGNIEFHTQIVIVPGLNDGEHLKSTLDDLHSLKPNIVSIAIVPVGLTRFRSNLDQLTPLSNEGARDIVGIAKNYYNDDNIVFVSDEIYAKAEYKMPSEEYYQGYLQLENGIGMVRLLIDEFTSALENFSDIIKKKVFDKKHYVITGTLASNYIEELLYKIKEVNTTFDYKVIAVKNEFFGNSVSVAGLLVGEDIIRALDKLKDDNCKVLIPRNSLNFEKTMFLDDLQLNDLLSKYNFDICVTDIDGTKLIENILNEEVN
jgi:putative radical SAM enzyme (TIGR03279 family)